ncbi:hypothetical protein [Magnetospirillum molischianum]|nr:hypothetical protein [Magnetospirillum molischianum]
MSASANREARQAEALRANLARRKAQSRARSEPSPQSPETEAASTTGPDTKNAPPVSE